MVTPAQGKARVNRMLGRMIRDRVLDVDQVAWTADPADLSVGEPFTNPSTPVVTLSRARREVVAVCVTWRKLEWMDEGQTYRDVEMSIRRCFAIATGSREVRRKNDRADGHRPKRSR